MLVDTDVLIWYLRGNVHALRRLDQLAKPSLSVVSYMELVQGVRDKRELDVLKKMLAGRAATLLPVTEPISRRAVALMETMSLSHGLQWADAMVAATAQEHQLALLTGNTRHFAEVAGLTVEVFRP